MCVGTVLLATEAAGWDPVWRLEDPVYASLRELPEFLALRQRLLDKRK